MGERKREKKITTEFKEFLFNKKKKGDGREKEGYKIHSGKNTDSTQNDLG